MIGFVNSNFQDGLSSSDYLALVELHLRNMLATVEGMDDLKALATEGKMEDKMEDKVEEEEELGRLLFFHKADTGFKCSTPPFQICKRDKDSSSSESDYSELF